YEQCFVPAVAGALSSTTEEANLYLDTVLSDHLPSAVHALDLDPAELPSFNTTVYSTGFTNHDLELVLTNRLMHGLSTALRRRGDCSTPTWKGANLTTSCHVTLEGLRFSYDASATGFDWFESRANFTLDALVQAGNAYIEVTSALGKGKRSC
ncbi:unnamed protein product, partial [Ixodes hexagonus]